MRKTIVSLFLISFFLLPTVNAQENTATNRQSFYIKPYVTNVAVNKAEIIWLEAIKANPAKVYIAGKPDLTSVSRIKEIKGCEKVIHITTLKGLQQNTVYEYRIDKGKKGFSGSFKTLASKDTLLNFVIYGDTRTLWWRHKKVAKQIAKNKPDFVVCSGDLVSNGNKFKQWKKQFFTPASAYLNKTVIWPVRGNHERNGYYFHELFNTNNEKDYYSFDSGNLHIIILDQYSSKDDYKQLYKWLEEDLKKNTSLWTIITYHKPTFNIGGHGSEWGRDKFLPLFEKYGVDVIVTGHSHLYERFKPISVTGVKPIIHIVSGGGGAPLYWAKKSSLLEGGIGKRTLHHLNFKINGNVLKMSAINQHGHIFDEMVLVKENDIYQQEIMKKTLSFDDVKNNE